MPEGSQPRLRRRPRVSSAEVHGEAVLLDLDGGAYYALNRTGAVVWELLAEPRTRDELHAALLLRFEVEAEDLRRDLAALLDDLARHGLIDEDR